MEDAGRQVQVRSSWSSSTHLGVCVPLRLREPAYGVAFTSAGLLPVELVEGAFWRVFPEWHLGGSGGGSPRTGLCCFCSFAYCSVLSDGFLGHVGGLCVSLGCGWFASFSRARHALADGGLVSAVGAQLAVFPVEASVLRCDFAFRVWKILVVCVSFLYFPLVARGGDAPLWCCVARVHVIATFWWGHLPLSCFWVELVAPLVPTFPCGTMGRRECCSAMHWFFVVGLLVQALFRCVLDRASDCALEAFRVVVLVFGLSIGRDRGGAS
ncbi:hypothetical protein Taro_056154 [Colocasia esculenta]|uniref:Uncharacterized protein n=1 Tax=Colocasia esculenta TaxID=4460 RepID=A0A843XVD0_COLES|nr:hypothetical protein [Colocasia esculenta]